MATYSAVLVNGPDTVNVAAAGGQSEPKLIGYADGSSIVVFEGDSHLSARRLDAQGEPFGAQIDIPNSATGSFSATALTDGSIVVAWEDDATGDVFAQRYSPSLQAIGGRTTLFDGTPSARFGAPSIAATPDGGYAAAAHLYLSENDQDISLRTFTAGGTRLNSTSHTPVSQDTYPSVAVSATTGNIALAFTHMNLSTFFNEVYLAMYSPTLGTLRSPSLAVVSGNVSDPYLISKNDGSFSLYFNAGTDPVRVAVSAAGAVTTPYGGNPAGAVERGSSVSPEGHIAYGLLLPEGAGGQDLNQAIDLVIAGKESTEHTIALANGPGWQRYSSSWWVNSYTLALAFSTTGGAGWDGQGSGIAVARYHIVRTEQGGAQADTMTGDGLVDVMMGNGGNDTMNGAGGPDTMRGGAGNDVYYVGDFGDYVDEITPGSDGWDTVYSSISYFLPTNVEALALLGSASLGAFGNALNNHLSGNAGHNILDGSFGADTMVGGAGDDIYYVDQAGDFVDEYSPGSSGFDTVYSAIDYVLGPGLDGLVLMGTLKLDGTGNALGNLIVGNVAANVLKGGGGADTVMGSLGRDTIDGGAGKDIADYSDKAKSISVNLDGSKTVTVKVGTKSEDKIKNIEGIIGSIKNDKISGDSKANVLNGHLGKDQLKGEGGKDQFVFNALGPANADKIADFRHNTDKIALEDWVFWSVGVKLDKAEFYAKAGAKAAHDADDRIVYNKTNGNLYYDSDGKGGAAAVLFATLSTKPALDHGDFIIV